MVEKRKAIINGQTITYIIKRSTRAKHIRLEVRRQTGLTVVVPRSYKIGYLPKLLESKGHWILSKLEKCNYFQSPSAEKELNSGDTIPYLGRELELVKRKDHKGIDNVKLEQNRLVVSHESFENGILELALEQWYRTQASKLIKEKTDKLSAQLGLNYNRLIIRGQRTRWGSCSHKKNLSFNWKLIMAPEPVIDYVIIHELVHLKEMNHSKKFWGLVTEHCPRWRQHKKWLKEHEVNLVAKLFD